MHRRPHHLSRSSHFRVLAWLAWLILAVAPGHGAAGGLVGAAHGTAPASPAMQMADHAMHDMSATTVDCCAGMTGHEGAAMGGCHCATTCAGVLPVPAMAGLAALPTTAMPMPRHGAAAPRPDRSPPLRPPLLQAA